ncbi:MAG: quinone oxidoreductase [Caulobacterales bacterium 32-69-10]|nr:MAG: quinone oxidoreductase [Caulobacterales bacterium 32-69-10]
MKAIQIGAFGGPEVMDLIELDWPKPGPGQMLVRHEAIGLNFIDVYQRTGLYPGPLPAVLGREAAGMVEQVGEGVTRFKPGDRVAYNNELGAYAEFNVVRADHVVSLPDAVPSRLAAASMLKGMTAEFLVRRIWPVEAGDTVLVHAAAGGVGTILCQWLAHVGVTVIGTVGSDAKADYARAHGCAEVLNTATDDIAARVREITGAGVKVAYDSIGKATVDASLASLAKRGLLVCYGNASGPPPPIEPGRLARGGSLFLTRPTLFDYIATTRELDDSAAALFEVIASGAVQIEIGQSFPLSEARAAHEALEGRKTTGATVLIP